MPFRAVRQFRHPTRTLGFKRRNGGNQFRKISSQRLARLRLQINFATIAKKEAAEAVPFGFILPVGPLGFSLGECAEEIVERKSLSVRYDNFAIQHERLALSDATAATSSGKYRDNYWPAFDC